MKKNRKNLAFTLAEILIVLVIVSFLSLIFVKTYHKTSLNYTNQYMGYAAYTALSNAAYDLAQKGCSIADMGATSPHPYCGGTTGQASTGFLPAYAITSDSPSRGFCNRLVTEEFNTVGPVNCSQTATDTTDFNAATPNFTTSNGMRFYNFGSNPANVNYSNLNTTQNVYYSVYVDLDGPAHDGVYNRDVIKFLIGMDGTVVLDPCSNLILPSSVKYIDNTTGREVIELGGVFYREAACVATQSTTAAPRSVLSTYCNSLPYGTGSTSYQNYTQQSSFAPDCSPNGGASTMYNCSFEVDKPTLLP